MTDTRLFYEVSWIDPDAVPHRDHVERGRRYKDFADADVAMGFAEQLIGEGADFFGSVEVRRYEITGAGVAALAGPVPAPGMPGIRYAEVALWRVTYDGIEAVETFARRCA